jgi:putative two-component system response regulator
MSMANPNSPALAGTVLPTILVVDDTPENIDLLTEVLKPHYRIKVASSGERALKITRNDPRIDLILLDIMMPGMNGYQVCQQLKSDAATRHIPVMFVTAMSEMAEEKYGLELGAVDYITKPISPPIVLARVKTQLAMKQVHDFLRDQNQFLEAEIERRTEEVNALKNVTIHTMASLAETRDSETGNHIRRTSHYVRILAEKLATHPRFSGFLTPKTIEMLFKTAPLHDIGKVGIPDHILLKPGRFTPAEFEIMKTHTTIGRDAILAAEQELGLKVDFLKFAKEIAWCHQEKWDGSGYPQGLAGDAIPVSARLMAVADVYDALICRRVYKEAMPHDAAAAIIIEGRGQHFDPDMVDAFVSLQAEFQEIASRYADHDSDLAKKAARLAVFVKQED